ncbi:MAG: site-specific DNA-methyltransferase [bacterium]
MGLFIWKKRTGSNDSKNGISQDQDFILSYAKSPSTVFSGVKKTFEKYSNPDNDPRGDWARDNLTCNKTASERPNLYYPITDPDTGIVYNPNPNRVWAYEKERMRQVIAEGKVLFPKDGKGTPMYKRHRSEIRSDAKPFSTLINTKINAVATKEVQEIFGRQVFSYPKSVDLIMQLLNQLTRGSDVIIDFFSGSATTAHAVMQLNAEDGSKRRFIMVQLPELCPEDSEAAKAGYATVSDIGKERIRRAGEKIKEDNKDKERIDELDIGFRVLKLDSTNMREVYYAAGEYTQDLLSQMEDNIKDDRTDMDLLYACLLEWGLPLSMPHTQEEIEGFTVHTYNDGDLIACFDKHISDAVVKKIAQRQPLRAVFRDASFAGSPEKINVEEIFKLLAPNTSVRVI